MKSYIHSVLKPGKVVTSVGMIVGLCLLSISGLKAQSYIGYLMSEDNPNPVFTATDPSTGGNSWTYLGDADAESFSGMDILLYQDTLLWIVGDGNIYRWNMNSPGTAATSYGSIPAMNGSLGSYDPDDAVGISLLFGSVDRAYVFAYTAGSAPIIFQLNLNTGGVVSNAFGPGLDYLPIIAHPDSTGHSIHTASHEDLAISPCNGTMVAAMRYNAGSGNDDYICIIDPATGIATPVVEVNGETDGLSFNANGDLFSSNDNNFFSVDLVTGNVTTVDNNLTSGEDLEGLDIDIPRPPIAINDTLPGGNGQICIDSVLVIDILDGDIDSDNNIDTAGITIVSAPPGFLTSVNPLNGEVTVTPSPGYHGVAILEYRLPDQAVGCATLTYDIGIIHITYDACMGMDSSCVEDGLDTFYVNSVDSALSYAWYTNNGATITTLAGDTMVTVDWTTSSMLNSFDTIYAVTSSTCGADTTMHQVYIRYCSEQCSNGVDDDGDGFIDCLDPDCGGTGTATMLIVSNTNNTGVGSYRQAVTDANANPGADTIVFNIPAADTSADGTWIIQPSGALPVLTDDSTYIDAITGSCGASCPSNLKVVIDGQSTLARAIDVDANYCTVEGLVIGNTAEAVQFRISTNGNSIICNHIGIAADGQTAMPNSTALANYGINFCGNGTIQGRNVISGNNSTSIFSSVGGIITVKGNYIGVNAMGSAAVPNQAGISIGSSTWPSGAVIGGSLPGEGNVISGNAFIGLSFFRSNNEGMSRIIQGNIIGLDATGMFAIPNGNDGIVIDRCDDVLIGGPTPAHGNIIAGNGIMGIDINDTDSLIISNNLIGVSIDTQVIANGTYDIDFTVGNANYYRALIGGPGRGNVIAGSFTGVNLVSSSSVPNAAVSVIENEIYSHGNIGIDIQGTSVFGGVTPNDAFDGDQAINDVLNYPEFNNVFMNGTNSLIYDFDLDVPFNAEGYRIEFFRDNVSHNPSGHGGGHHYLGFINITHAGSGSQNYTGTLITNRPVFVGDTITTTTTEVNSSEPFGFGPTSEFSGFSMLSVIPPEDCNNGIDDDLDGLVDFADPDCAIPIAVDDSVTTDDATPIVISVLANDTLLLGADTSSVAVTGGPNNGNTTVNADGTITYMPTGNGPYMDTFTYVVCDTFNGGRCDTAQVVVNVIEPTPIGCVSEAFVSHYVATNPMDLSTIDSVEQVNLTADDVLHQRFNSLGYNPTDGNLWATIDGTDMIVRIDGNFDTTVFSIPSFPVPGGGGYTQGDVDFNGVFHFGIGIDPTIHMVDVNPSSGTYLTYLGSIVYNDSTFSADFALNPVDSLFYTVRNISGELIRMNPNTSTLTVLANTGYTGNVGGAFFDAEGSLYVVNNSNGDVSRIASVHTATVGSASAVELMFTNPTLVGGLDAARCPQAPRIEIEAIVAVDDTISTNDVTPIAVNVLFNDTAPTGIDTSSVAVTNGPFTGTTSVNTDGSITYTPTGVGPYIDSFTYVVCDTQAPAHCDTAQVVVNVEKAVEICNNGVDDDGDGLIDEYCFPEAITTFCGTSLEGVFNNGSPFAMIEMPGNGRALLNQHTFGGVSEISIMTIDSNLNSVNSTMISSPTSTVIGFRPVGAIYVPNHGICVYGENEGNSTSDTRMGLAMIDEITLTAQWSSYVSPGPGWTYGSTHQFGEAIYDPISGNIMIVGQTGGAHATFVSGTFTIYSAIDPSNGTVIENEAYVVPNNNNPQGMNSSSQSIFHSGSHVALGGYGGAGKGPIFSIIDTTTNEKIVNNHYPFPHTAGQFVSIRDLTEINGSYYGTLLNTWDGASTDAGIIKIAPNGDLVWAYMTDTTTESTYDIFGGIYPIEDQASFFVLGTSNGSWTSGGQDLVVMRVDTNGTVLWQKGVGGTGYDAMANGNNAVSVKGGLEIYAWVPTPISGRNFKVIHIDTAGNVSTDNCHDIPGTYSMIDVSPVTGTVAFSDTSLPQTFTSITISDSAIVNDTFICGCCPTIANNVVTPADTACEGLPVVIDGSTPMLNFGTPFYQWFRSSGATGPWTVVTGGTSEDLTVSSDTSGFYYKRYVFVPDCPGDTSIAIPVWLEDCPEICDNGIDDDGDGLVDCADPDCALFVSCYSCNAVGIDTTTGDTTWQVVTADGGFNRAIAYRYTGHDQTFTVPAGVGTVGTKLWGAGGGGSQFAGRANGGAGGYAGGDVAVLSGFVLNLVVGEGGDHSETTTTYGGGGAGGEGILGGTLHPGSSGGGRSAIQVLSTEIITAAGGGGAGPHPSADRGEGGAGGDDIGQEGEAGAGFGITESTGGVTAGGGTGPGGTGGIRGMESSNSPTYDGFDGSQFQGGRGGGFLVDNPRGGGGGGGGGYFGGGGGNADIASNEASGGAGGSGYIGGVTGGVLTAGDRTIIANTGDVHYLPGIAAAGRKNGNKEGGHGMIVIQWTDTVTVLVEICNNGIDDDCDGFVDEDDTDCVTPDVYAVNDINVSLNGEQVMGNVLTNDFHTTGDTFAINMAGTVNPTNGTLVLNSDGSYSYQPDSGFVGQDQFTYVICDTLTPQNCDTANVVIQVTNGDVIGTNDAPIANDDAYITYQDQAISGQVLNNDVDPEGSTLTSTIVDGSNIGGGSLVAISNGQFTYTPAAGFVGAISFTYAACDTNTPSACDTALVTIDILPGSGLNDPPFAGDDAAMGMDTITGDMLPNDSDPEGSPLVVNSTPISGPNNGQVTIGSDGTYQYVPTDGFTGTDWFVYEICDTNNPVACAQATVFITVLPEQICVNISFFLEGTFKDDGDSMTTLLNHFCDVLPLTHPYNVIPWHYAGTESVSSMPNGVVDWVLISLRNGIYLDSTKLMTAALLYADGQVRTVAGEEVICYNYQDDDSMYVVVEHRNHMAAMTPTPITAPSEDPVIVDFRHSESFIVGGTGFNSAGQNIVGTWNVGGASIYALFSGDPAKESAGKNDINSNDIPPLLSVIGQFGSYTVGDHNLDCDHNSNDLPFILNNLAKTSVVE